MHSAKFLIVLAAAFAPAMGIALPQSEGGFTAEAIEPALQENPATSPIHQDPVPEPEGESFASGIGSTIVGSLVSGLVSEAPSIIGGLFGGGSSGGNSQALQSCISMTQACCDNVQGKSGDSSACNDSNVKAAFATNSACAGPNDSAVQHATDACNKVLG